MVDRNKSSNAVHLLGRCPAGSPRSLETGVTLAMLHLHFLHQWLDNVLRKRWRAAGICQLSVV